MVAVRILGIDPGTLTVGFAVLELAQRERRVGVPAETPLAQRAGNLVRVGGSASAPRLLEAGALRLGRGRPLPDRLAALDAGIAGLVARFAPGELALEEAFHGRSAQAALRVGEARGVVIAAARRSGLAVHQYAPARIKRAVAGHGAAPKAAVAAMAARSLGIAGFPGPADVGDAVAVALCRAEELRSGVLRDAH